VPWESGQSVGKRGSHLLSSDAMPTAAAHTPYVGTRFVPIRLCGLTLLLGVYTEGRQTGTLPLLVTSLYSFNSIHQRKFFIHINKIIIIINEKKMCNIRVECRVELLPPVVVSSGGLPAFQPTARSPEAHAFYRALADPV
jgi:hypothetical protein